MTLIYILILAGVSIFSRLLPTYGKGLILVASILVVLPTMTDWEEVGIYYTSDGIADIFILLDCMYYYHGGVILLGVNNVWRLRLLDF